LFKEERKKKAKEEKKSQASSKEVGKKKTSFRKHMKERKKGSSMPLTRGPEKRKEGTKKTQRSGPSRTHSKNTKENNAQKKMLQVGKKKRGETT